MSLDSGSRVSGDGRVAIRRRGSRLAHIAAGAGLLVSGSPVAGQTRPADDEGAGRPSAACPGGADASSSALTGRVSDLASGVPLPGARIVAEIRPEERRDAGGDEDGFQVEAASDGTYLLCGLPAFVGLTVRATFAGHESEPTGVTLVPGGRARRDFELRVGETGPGRLVGRVTDRETGRPVDAVEILLLGSGLQDGPRHVATDAQGRFAAEELPPGEYRVDVRRIGYGDLREWVTVPPDRTLQVDVELAAEPITVDPIVVTTVRSVRLEEKGFYRRRAWAEPQGAGYFITRADIERRRPQRISQMIAEVPGMGVECGGSPLRCELRLTRNPLCVRANVYVDGVRAIRAETVLEEVTVDALVLPHDVEGFEVYPGAASLPAEFSGDTGRCGAVVIWTRSGP